MFDRRADSFTAPVTQKRDYVVQTRRVPERRDWVRLGGRKARKTRRSRQTPVFDFAERNSSHAHPRL